MRVLVGGCTLSACVWMSPEHYPSRVVTNQKVSKPRLPIWRWIKLTERWISQSEKILAALAKQSAQADRDRLAIVSTMMLALNAVDRSVHGWRSWVGRLRLMSQFTEDELLAMEAGLIERVRAFVEYDVAVTKQYKNKIPGIPVARLRRTVDQNQRHVV
jgi:hypothetical protein